MASEVPFNPEPLRRARRIKGWSVRKLATRADLSTGSVSQILSGKQAGVRGVTELAEALDVDPAECWPAETPRQETAV